jgi:hypothetical protein
VRGGDLVTVDTKRAAVIKALEDAIEAFNGLMRASNDDCDDVMAVDAVLIVGSQWIDEDGDRCGGVSFFPRNGCQPSYITAGLLDLAREQLTDP